MLRWFVQNWIRQEARGKLAEALATAATGGNRESGDENPGPGQRAVGGGPHDEPRQPVRCDVAVLFALRSEAGGFVDRLSNVVTTRCASYVEHLGVIDARPLLAAECGVGQKTAAKATEDIIAIHKPSWIVSAGFAGGLSGSLRKGHVLMADHVISADGKSLNVGMKMDQSVVASTSNLHVGRLLTIDHVARTIEEKRALGAQHGALACDMESFGMAEACRQAKTRFLSVRVITDAVDDELPPEVDRMLTQPTWAAKLGAATGAVFRRPSSVKDMWQLKEDALRASDLLATFLVGVVSQLR